MLTLVVLVKLVLDLVFFIVIAQFVMSWLVAFNVVNLHQRMVHQLWYGLNRLTEPVYRPIRRVLPDMGGLDLSPMIVLFALYAIEMIIDINFMPMAYGR